MLVLSIGPKGEIAQTSKNTSHLYLIKNTFMEFQDTSFHSLKVKGEHQNALNDSLIFSIFRGVTPAQLTESILSRG